MTKHCSLSISDGRDASAWRETSALLDRADRHAHTALVSDQARAETKQGLRTLWQVRSEDTLVGVVLVGSGEFDLVIDPDARDRGFASIALPEILSATSGTLRTWVHGNDAAADALLSEAGFVPVRTLLKLELAETHSLPKARDLPEGYTVVPFTDDRGTEWLALNARVFAEHPEQGRLTEQDLTSRTREPWFNADDFLLLFDERGQLVGYCWLKVVDDEGEVYVIGVAPELAGQRIGSALFTRGLEHLINRKVSKITLYVEEENTPAVRLYLSSGFTEASRSRQWMLDRRSP